MNVPAKYRAGRIRSPTPVHRFVHIAAIVRTGEGRKVKRPVAGKLSQARHRGDWRTILEHPADERRRDAVRGTIHLGTAVVAERQSSQRFMLKGRRLLLMVMVVDGDDAGGRITESCEIECAHKPDGRSV